MGTKLKVGILVASLVIGLYSCKDSDTSTDTGKTTTTASNDVPVTISYQLVKEYPHSTLAFSEGLEYRDGILYESTGEYGTSEVRKVDPNTGEVIASHKMDSKYFGEGLTVLNGKIYQLTYREHTGFIYDAKTLKPEGTFSYSADEGWGMTNDGKYLIYDDGKNLLHYMEPGTFKEIKTLHVTDENGAVDNLNELEYIKGYIYANQWKTDNVLKIDTGTGKVVARANLGELRQKIMNELPNDNSPHPDVMNGIAYDAVNNRILVTGKYWKTLFEIKLDN